jgi:flagellar M-ring protein FliF
MNQILALMGVIMVRRNIIAGLAAAGMILAILGMTRLTGQGDLSLLYSGLDPAASGEVIRALDAQGAKYEVRGTAIYVDPGARDSLRMSLAADGLPASGTQGYELLDSLSGFGTTSQMFDAAYWRAKEGELARTILASPDVRAARVHISAISGRPFDRDFRPTASVALTPGATRITPELARAVRYLVAAAVAGLAPEDVAVIDTRSGAVLGPEMPGTTDPGGKAEELRRNVQTLLEARVGPGKAIVEVSVETVQQREEIVERQIDPNSRVQISTETSEKTGSANDTGNANVTVASNLPAGAGANGGNAGQSQSQDSETRERTNFDVSETKRQISRGPGGIARITVAVLVDGIHGTDAAGNPTWQPRSDQELAALQELVASAVGFNATRNDTITIKSLEFLPAAPEGTLAEAGAGASLHLDLQTLIEMAALALVALALGLFVLRPALFAKAGELPGLPPPRPGGDEAPAEANEAAVLTGTIDDDTMPDFVPTMATATDAMDDLFGTGDAQNPVARLRQLIADRREETVEILRSWMEEEAAE